MSVRHSAAAETDLTDLDTPDGAYPRSAVVVAQQEIDAAPPPNTVDGRKKCFFLAKVHS